MSPSDSFTLLSARSRDHLKQSEVYEIEEPEARGRQILIMNVDIGDGRLDEIVVHESDEPEDLARLFCEKYDLSIKICEALSLQIESNIEQLVDEQWNIVEDNTTTVPRSCEVSSKPVKSQSSWRKYAKDTTSVQKAAPDKTVTDRENPSQTKGKHGLFRTYSDSAARRSSSPVKFQSKERSTTSPLEPIARATTTPSPLEPIARATTDLSPIKLQAKEPINPFPIRLSLERKNFSPPRPSAKENSGGIGHRLYEKGVLMKKTLQEISNKKQKEQQEKEDAELTFSPKITTKHRANFSESEIPESVRAKAREFKIQKLKQDLEYREQVACTFKPTICAGSRVLMKKRSFTGIDRVDQLYKEAKELEEKRKCEELNS